MIWNPFKKRPKNFMDLEVGDIVRYRKEGTCKILTYLGAMCGCWFRRPEVRTYPYMTVHPCKPFDSYNYEVFE